jgi:hypothetical protein
VFGINFWKMELELNWKHCELAVDLHLIIHLVLLKIKNVVIIININYN